MSAPLPCPECNGTRWIDTTRSSGIEEYQILELCDECCGTGVAMCEACCLALAVEQVADELLCEECAEDSREEREADTVRIPRIAGERT